MPSKIAQSFKYLFFILVVIELYFEFIHHQEVIFILSPVLLPLVIFYIYFSVNGKLTKMHYQLIAAIAFSWMGGIWLGLTPENAADLSILGIPKNKYFFFGGVASFLIAHLFFIASYLRFNDNQKPSLFQQSKWPFVPIVVYGIIILAVIIPAILSNPEKSVAAIPVVFYAIILCCMVAFALNRYQRVNHKSFYIVLIGSILFLLSDSLIALNFLAFEGAIPHANFWINSTFLLAEFMIADGLVCSWDGL